MSKTPTGKRRTFELDFYWRGKKKTPSVNFTFANNDYDGIPDGMLDCPEFKAFDKAARGFCKKLVESGELD